MKPRYPIASFGECLATIFGMDWLLFTAFLVSLRYLLVPVGQNNTSRPEDLAERLILITMLVLSLTGLVSQQHRNAANSGAKTICEASLTEQHSSSPNRAVVHLRDHQPSTHADTRPPTTPRRVSSTSGNRFGSASRPSQSSGVPTMMVNHGTAVHADRAFSPA